MFKKVLIANRGEIALRIIRACRELGVTSVAVYSDADVDSMHVQLADEAVCIGSGPSSESYLKMDRIMAAAEIAEAEAIHPGYGFLSENARFAEICEQSDVKFIGPSADVIRKMGDKNTARATAVAAGVPVTPGSDGIITSIEHGKAEAARIGYPVMIKATAGGGGRGMRPCEREEDFETLYNQASQEAIACFNNGDCYLEKLVLKPHHVEFQVFGDSHGDFLHLGERDCSMQRRNQKIIEECPSPLLSADMRKRMGEEMIRVAAGLPFSEHVVNAEPRGHSIECRINAEDPYNNFAPSPGKIGLWYAPGGKGVRVDTHVYSGYTVPPYYDSMIAKLIITAATRELAIKRMERALKEFMIEGIKTTIPFQLEIMQHPDFINGTYGIDWVGEYIKETHTLRKSAPLSSKCVAKEWRNLCGVISKGIPAAEIYFLSRSLIARVVIWRFSFERKSGP